VQDAHGVLAVPQLVRQRLQDFRGDGGKSLLAGGVPGMDHGSWPDTSRSSGLEHLVLNVIVFGLARKL
jgi:hypothetical protein